MLWLRKSKVGFTLIELMVVVAIIGVLALLGLRMYTGQQDKAKNAIVKANVGTVQTLLQAELADTTISSIDTDTVILDSGIYNPWGVGGATADDGQQTTNPAEAVSSNSVAASATASIGEVWVFYDTSNIAFVVNGKDADNTDVYTVDLKAQP